MARRQRRNHSGAFKAKVALSALREDKTLFSVRKSVDIMNIIGSGVLEAGKEKATFCPIRMFHGSKKA